MIPFKVPVCFSDSCSFQEVCLRYIQPRRRWKLWLQVYCGGTGIWRNRLVQGPAWIGQRNYEQRGILFKDTWRGINCQDHHHSPQSHKNQRQDTCFKMAQQDGSRASHCQYFPQASCFSLLGGISHLYSHHNLRWRWKITQGSHTLNARQRKSLGLGAFEGNKRIKNTHPTRHWIHQICLSSHTGLEDRA